MLQATAPSDPHYFVGQTSVGSTPQPLLRQLTALSSSDQKRNEVSTSSIVSSYTRPFITCDQPTSSISLSSHSNSVDNIASRWWEVAAQRIVETSQDFGEIKLICKFIPIEDTTILYRILARQQPDWLDEFLNLLRGSESGEENYGDNLHKAKEIVGLLVELDSPSRPPPSLAWDGTWIHRLMMSQMDAATIAERIDSTIYSEFRMVTFQSWAKYWLGYSDPFVSRFLDTASNSRNNLAQYFPKDAWKSIKEALKNPHPITRWMFDEEASIHPNAPLCSFFAPIRKLLEKPVHLTPQLRRLAILATRFEDKTRRVNVNWDVPLSAEFTLLNLVERYTPETLAKIMTDETWNAFRRISPADFLDADTQHMRRITRRWSCLCNDTATFVASDSKLFPYMTKLAETFIRLRNHHYAAAMGIGLFSKGVPCQLNGSLVGTLLNPTNNFAALKAHEKEAPGLPHIFPLINELQQSGNNEEQLLQTFKFVKIFGGNRTACQAESEEEKGSERGGKETTCGDSGGGQIGRPTITRCSPSQFAHPPLLPWPSQLKRKVALDLNGEEPQQDPAKRKKAAHNQYHDSTLRGPSGSYPIDLPENGLHEFALVSRGCASPNGSTLHSLQPRIYSQAIPSPGYLSSPARALTDGQHSMPVDWYRGSSLAAEKRVRIAKSSAEYRKRKANSIALQRDSTARTNGDDPALNLTLAAVDHSVATGDAHRGAIPHPASVSSARMTKSAVGYFTCKKRAGKCGERKPIRMNCERCVAVCNCVQRAPESTEQNAEEVQECATPPFCSSEVAECLPMLRIGTEDNLEVKSEKQAPAVVDGTPSGIATNAQQFNSHAVASKGQGSTTLPCDDTTPPPPSSKPRPLPERDFLSIVLASPESTFGERSNLPVPPISEIHFQASSSPPKDLPSSPAKRRTHLAENQTPTREQEGHQVVEEVQAENSPPIQQDLATRTDCSSPSPDIEENTPAKRHPLKPHELPTGVKRLRGQPRKPDPSPKKARTRSFSGCWTCKRRKRKCDETKPSCTTCDKSNIICEGYPKKVVWKGKQNMATEVRERTAAPPRYKDTQRVNSPDITSEDQVSTTIPSSPPPDVEIHLTYKRSNGDNANRVVTVPSTELSDESGLATEVAPEVEAMTNRNLSPRGADTDEDDPLFLRSGSRRNRNKVVLDHNTFGYTDFNPSL